MTWTVMKFGGSSLATPERVAHVATLIAAQSGKVAVVVSAQGDTTDHLEEALALAARGDREGARALGWGAEAAPAAGQLSPQHTAVRMGGGKMARLHRFLFGVIYWSKLITAGGGGTQAWTPDSILV